MSNLLSQTKIHQTLKPTNNFISKNPKKTIQSRKFSFNLNAAINCDSWMLNNTKKIMMIKSADKCIHHCNLKLNLFNLMINDNYSEYDSKSLLIPFYRKLRKYGPIIQSLKLYLRHLFLSCQTLVGYFLGIQFKPLINKLANLKALHLEIYPEDLFDRGQMFLLDDICRCIGLYFKNLQIFRLKLNFKDFRRRSRYELRLNWDYLKYLNNLESFTLELDRDNINCSRNNLINLLHIILDHPKLKKFHIEFNIRNSAIDIWPLQFFSNFFERLYDLQSLKLDMPIRAQNMGISEELIKVLKKFPNIKDLHLVCGDISYGFRDKTREIFECLLDLPKLQKLVIKYGYNYGDAFLLLGDVLGLMKKLEILILDIKYTGPIHDDINTFIYLMEKSKCLFKHLSIQIISPSSTIYHIFWGSLSKVISRPTLEIFSLSLIVKKIFINNNDMELFADKLIQHTNLSKLNLIFHSDFTYNGSGLIIINEALIYLKYITELILDYRNVNCMIPDFFYILQDSLKNNKYIKTLIISINDELERYIFPFNVINDIMRLFNHKNQMKNLKFVDIKIPIFKLRQYERDKLLDIINIKQIYEVDIFLQEYELYSNRIFGTFINSSNTNTNKIFYGISTRLLGSSGP